MRLIRRVRDPLRAPAGLSGIPELGPGPARLTVTDETHLALQLGTFTSREPGPTLHKSANTWHFALHSPLGRVHPNPFKRPAESSVRSSSIRLRNWARLGQNRVGCHVDSGPSRLKAQPSTIPKTGVCSKSKKRMIQFTRFKYSTAGPGNGVVNRRTAPPSTDRSGIVREAFTSSHSA